MKTKAKKNNLPPQIHKIDEWTGRACSFPPVMPLEEFKTAMGKIINSSNKVARVNWFRRSSD